MELINQAKALRKDLRRRIIMNYLESDLHELLKELFQAMEPDYTVEVTHGPNEFGKDLVIVKSDKFTLEVIGVVVKRGYIRGRTLGNVDDVKQQVATVLSKGDKAKLREIESQARQAKLHRAKLRSSLVELPVSKVFVVLAGEFSNQARERLNVELDSEMQIFDIEWLIQNFTKYYPQIFFEGQAVDFVQKKILELEKNHGLDKLGKNLSEYFVEPIIKTLSDPINFDEKNFEDIKILLKRKKLPFLRLGALSKRERQLILLGDPGTGKTSAMAKLAVEMYQRAYELLIRRPGRSGKTSKIRVPVLVSARDLLDSESVRHFLKAYFKSDTVAGRFDVDVIMVDGLDEIQSANRQAVIGKLDQFAEELNCSYILTSRKVDILNTLPQKYQKYELLPFEFGQALQLFSKLVSDEKTLATMKDGLEKIQAQILLVPLSLMMLIELIVTHKEIPASVTELYDRFFDMALGRWDEEKGIEVLFEYLIKKKFLGDLAYCEFYKKNRLQIPVEDFKRFLDSYAVQYGWNANEQDGFVQELERAGILDQREEVNFKHRSFLEYFAAFYVYENREDIEDLNNLITNIYFDGTWSEVAFFYVGLRREISQDLLERIRSYESSTPTAVLGKFISGRLLQAGWHSPDQRHVVGIKNAITYAPRVRDLFQEIINSSDSDIPVILSDFVVMSLTDLSFGSAFLERHIRSTLKQFIDSRSYDDIYMAVSLYWSIYRFLDPHEVNDITNALLAGLADFTRNEQAKILLLMILIEEDTKTKRLIRRQINKLIKKSPEVFKALLPAKRKGFR